MHVPTPWHQDESYWLNMPDKRAVSFWVALQDVNVDNGCMWFVPGSHKLPLREHWKAKEGHHINQCKCTEVSFSKCIEDIVLHLYWMTACTVYQISQFCLGK